MRLTSVLIYKSNDIINMKLNNMNSLLKKLCLTVYSYILFGLIEKLFEYNKFVKNFIVQFICIALILWPIKSRLFECICCTIAIF